MQAGRKRQGHRIGYPIRAGPLSKVSAGGLSPARFASLAKNPPTDETIHKQLAAQRDPARPTHDVGRRGLEIRVANRDSRRSGVSYRRMLNATVADGSPRSTAGAAVPVVRA